MRELIEKTVKYAFPELESKLHLPIPAKVVKIPDPPAGGGKSTPETPKYAVDVQVLNPDGTERTDIPVFRDIPVSLNGAGSERGFTALPQPGTLVELAFFCGQPSLPFIRSILPNGLTLARTDGKSMRWQQTQDSYQEVDADGNWNRKTSENITDTAGKDVLIYGAHLWFGTLAVNTLQLLSDFMAQTAAAFGEIASHTHTSNVPGSPTSAGTHQGKVTSSQSAVTTLKSTLDSIKKVSTGHENR